MLRTDARGVKFLRDNMKTLIDQYLQLAEIGVTDDEIHNKLSGKDNNEIIAKIIHFVPIVASRTLFGDMGVTFQDNYYILDKNGDLLSQGSIQDDSPFFNALRSFEFTGKQLKAVAFRSSEAHALNNALNGGSDPKDLVMAPPVIFSEQPTENGMKKGQLTIQKLLSKVAPIKKKSRWKFWQ